MKAINYKKYIKIMLAIFLMITIFFPRVLFASNWLEAEITGEEKVWIDTSHWETRKFLVKDGYWQPYTAKRWVDQSYYVTKTRKVWVDDSYKVRRGYWKTETYRVWVNSGYTHYYQARKWVDTSHYEIRYRTITGWVPVNLTIYMGCSSYGWGVYSFASKYAGSTIIRYRGRRYKAIKEVIDYRPVYGGRVYAKRYRCYRKEVKVRQPYRVWISSGYWKTYMDNYHVDTSHWETRTKKVWVDTSYVVNKGHWEYRDEKVLVKDGYFEEYTAHRWIDTSYYETKKVWIEDGYYAKPLHGTVTVRKEPRYVFTRWHKNEAGEESEMELEVKWDIENGKIEKVKVYEDLHRFDEKGIERIDICNKHLDPKQKGSISSNVKFENAGSEESKLHIYLYSSDGRVAHVYFSNPINGFRSINIKEDGIDKDADEWLGGNNFGEIEI